MFTVSTHDHSSALSRAATRQAHCHSSSSILLRAAVGFTLFLVVAAPVLAETMHHITIDGDFSDWANVPSYYDPAGTNVHNGIPNTHDTDGDTPDYIPKYVNHPDVDLLEYKFTHDSSNLYAYFRAEGVIGNTISNATKQGRYYVIVTIDVDNNTNTGYGLYEGGYFPTSYGYDMNMEFEFYDGHPNKGNYLNHCITNDVQLAAAFQDQMNGIVCVRPGSYKSPGYTEWVWYDSPSGPGSGTNNLPPPDDYASIRFVRDKGAKLPGNYPHCSVAGRAPGGNGGPVPWLHARCYPTPHRCQPHHLPGQDDQHLLLARSQRRAGAWQRLGFEYCRAHQGLLLEPTNASDRPRRLGRRAAVLGSWGCGHAASADVQPGEPGLAGGARVRDYESSDLARRRQQHLLPVGATLNGVLLCPCPDVEPAAQSDLSALGFLHTVLT